VENMPISNPCLSCIRVRNPDACDNKNCRLWRVWFTYRWETMRKTVRAGMDRLPQSPEGVRIGGRSYAPPHRVREYLQKNPCTDCPYRRGLCSAPCKLRRAWEKSRKEVHL